MLKPNFIYEWKLLIRSKWLQLLTILLVLLFGFATNNGLQRVEKRNSVIAFAQDEVAEADAVMFSLLDSLEKGLPVSLRSSQLPTNPMVVGNSYPRLAAMPPNDFTFVATGQSDMFSHYKTPKVSRGKIIEDFTEMTSPVQLLFGNFDLGFVIVYLLPLLIVAFSYNVLSSEKESGILKLLASQPIGIRNWVLHKLLIRFSLLSVLVLVSLLAVLLLLGASPFSKIGSLFTLFGLILAYMLFWFALAFLVNLWVGSSAKNAVAMLGLWIGFVLLIPSVLNQLGTAIYPMPSRTLMINDLREMQADITKRQDKILDNYLRDHPEYAVNDSSQTRNFWHGYMASQNLLRKEIAPVVNRYNEQLENQQKWINKFKWLSPAVTLQESLNKLSGTASTDYENYRQQVLVFSEQWRAYFMPMLYNNTDFEKESYNELPKFIYKQKQYHYSASFVILMISLMLFGVGFVSSRARSNYTIVK
ncbi:DUF3526 domain-containing protein [Maribacter sp.]|uniref:DUF3526 domain-containing protein n=1 Tax=Maribacter sp. TaxID=1897614 RepID=UPI003299FA8B